MKDTANDPDPTGENDCLFTAKQVCEFCDCESTDEGTGGHGSDDGALGAGARVTESVLVGIVLLWARWAAVRKWKWRLVKGVVWDEGSRGRDEAVCESMRSERER